MTINNLLRFLKPYEILNFIEIKKETDANASRNFDTNIEIFDSTLPNFENELLQVVDTTDQKTIDAYFEWLASDIKHIRQRVSLENIQQIINKFNSESLASFEKEVEEKTDEYFKSENRQLKHLEEYDGYDPNAILGLYLTSRTKLKNYNFYCIEKHPNYIEQEFAIQYFDFLVGLTNRFLEVALKYGRDWKDGKIKSKHLQFIKPILFVEGELDIVYIKKAASLLGEDALLNNIDIRQRGGFNNLDKLWDIYKLDNWETVPQKKIFLYDCDTEKQDENNILNFKRVIPSIIANPIKRGIENLFSQKVIDKATKIKPALVDVTTSRGLRRGKKYSSHEFSIDKQEKRNFCEWVCENCSRDDFENFSTIFTIIKQIIQGEVSGQSTIITV